jgi:hypothetical protein
MYLNGSAGRLISLRLNFATLPVFELGPDANDYVMIAPSSAGAIAAPIIAAATNAMDWGSDTSNWPGITIIDPSNRLMRDGTFDSATRVRVLNGGIARNTDSLGRIGGEIATVNGVSSRKYTITQANYAGQTAGTGLTAILEVADSDSYIGTAIQLKAVNNSGFIVNLSFGRALHASDRIKLTYVYKMSGTPASGTFRWRYQKDAATTGGALTVSATYTRQVVYTTLAGVTDDFYVGAWNSGVTDATCNIQAIVVEVLDPTDAVSADNGDAAATLVVGTDEKTQRWGTALTADRAVALSTTGAIDGDKFHIVRTGGDTGGPWNLNVGTGPLKALLTNTWCNVEYNGTAWMLTAYGAL